MDTGRVFTSEISVKYSLKCIVWTLGKRPEFRRKPQEQVRTTTVNRKEKKAKE